MKRNINDFDDITVVLTAFKRIDSLRLQIEAINKQTIKPKEIWLFQDKIPNDYVINLQEELIKEFDNVKIAEKNMGVWGRFEFAGQAKTKYICIFDDDTIPGKKWLENCISNMKKERGIYGAIGIVLFENNDYPQDRYCRVGWASPNNDVREVDFVGHSWFLETEWIKYMFEEAGFMKKYKYAAEDMSISYAALKYGIKTFVPPHPYSDVELWGSQPEKGTILGESSVALSANGNWDRMNRAVNELLSTNWNCLYKRKPKYIKTIGKESKKAHRIVVMKKIIRLFNKKF